jgi:hypothetical protein
MAPAALPPASLTALVAPSITATMPGGQIWQDADVTA